MKWTLGFLFSCDYLQQLEIQDLKFLMTVILFNILFNFKYEICQKFKI